MHIHWRLLKALQARRLTVNYLLSIFQTTTYAVVKQSKVDEEDLHEGWVILSEVNLPHEHRAVVSLLLVR